MSPRTLLVPVAAAVVAATALLGAAAPASASPAPDPHAPAITVSATDPNAVALDTRPGAAKTVWLVFQGGQITGTPWNENRDPAGLNGTPIHFDPVATDSPQLRTAVTQRLAELFSPFDITFTTTRPSADALSKDSPTDTAYGDVVVFTSEMLGASGLTLHDADDADGIAHRGTFGDTSDNYVWVTNHGMVPGDTKQLAEVAAHEIGHTLGLGHHGYDDTAVSGLNDAYYTPDQGLWAPIMGSADDVAMARWSDGQYPHAANPGQDDLAVMTDQSAATSSTRYFLRSSGKPADLSNGYCGVDGEEMWIVAGEDCDVPENEKQYVDQHSYYSGRLDYLPDDHGDTAATATALTSGISADGRIGRNGDKDVFAVTAPAAGVLDIGAAVRQPETMLDAVLTVRDSTGAVLDTDNPDLRQSGGDRRQGVDGASASGRVALPSAGTYYVQVEGTGFGDPASITRKDTTAYAAAYGSLGSYSLTASFLAPQLDAKVDGRTVTLGAALGGDALPVEYQLAGGAWQSYSAPFTVSGSGAATVAWRAAAMDGALVSTSTLAIAASDGAVRAEALGTVKTVLVGEVVSGYGVRVTDAHGDAVLGHDVTFTITGGQTADGATTAHALTNAAGIAVAPAVSATAAGTIGITADGGLGTVTLPVITVTAPAPSVSGALEITANIVSGKVVLTLVAWNQSGAPTTMQLKTRYGTKTFTDVPAGGTATATIKTYATSIPAGTASVTITAAAGTATIVEPYGAR